MNDLISRQDFDKFLEDAEKESVKNRKYVFASALNTIRGNLRNFPSAQPERKGEWNVIQGDIVVCSKCGMLAPESMTGCLVNRHLEPNRTNFCPNCGADMRGET